MEKWFLLNRIADVVSKQMRLQCLGRCVRKDGPLAFDCNLTPGSSLLPIFRRTFPLPALQRRVRVGDRAAPAQQIRSTQVYERPRQPPTPNPQLCAPNLPSFSSLRPAHTFSAISSLSSCAFSFKPPASAASHSNFALRPIPSPAPPTCEPVYCVVIEYRQA